MIKETKTNKHTHTHIFFLIFKFIFIYLLHVLFELNIESIFEKRKNQPKRVEMSYFLFI